MNTLHCDDPRSLFHRVRPEAGRPAGSLFLPHGVGGNASSLADIAQDLDPRMERVSPETPSSLSALVRHGQYDDQLPVALAAQSDAQLMRLGVPHDTRLYPVGHALSADIVNDFSRWIDQQLHLN